jgi:MSHA pilin protein MshC
MVVKTAIPFFSLMDRTLLRRSACSGFTFMELLAVLAIVAILSISAIAMFDRLAFDTGRFGRELESALAYAQKSAVAQRRTVTVTVAAGSVSFTVCSNFNPCGASVALPLPSESGGSALTAPSGVTLSPATTFAFTPGGSTDQASAVTITVTGSGANSVVVEAGTAYVHPG